MLGGNLFTLNKFTSSGLYALYWGCMKNFMLAWLNHFILFLRTLRELANCPMAGRDKCHLNGMTSEYTLAWKIVRVFFIDSLLICSNIPSWVPQGAVLDVVLKYFISKWDERVEAMFIMFGNDTKLVGIANIWEDRIKGKMIVMS